MFGAIGLIGAVTATASTLEMFNNMTDEEKDNYLKIINKMEKNKPLEIVQNSCSPLGFILGLIIGSSGD